MKSESEISKEIQDEIKRMGLKWSWRNQVYSGRVKSGAWLVTGKPGISDLILVVYGKTIYIEIKDHKYKQSDEQKEFQAHCEANNQPYWVVRSLDQFKALMVDISTN